MCYIMSRCGLSRGERFMHIIRSIVAAGAILWLAASAAPEKITFAVR